MYILNGVNYQKSKSSMPLGYLKYAGDILEFYKYKGFPSGRYPWIIYLFIKLIELFMKDKLMITIKKDDIESLKIEEGIEVGGIGGRLMNMMGSNKMPDTFVVKTKVGEEYRFMIQEREDLTDGLTFQDLVINMGMFLS